MEHRKRKRVRIPIKLRVTIDGLNSLYTLTHDISNDGLFMRLTHPDLQRHACVTVELQDDVKNDRWRVRAMVVHSSSRGTGVLFAEPLPASFDIKTRNAERGELSDVHQLYANSH